VAARYVNTIKESAMSAAVVPSATLSTIVVCSIPFETSMRKRVGSEAPHPLSSSLNLILQLQEVEVKMRRDGLVVLEVFPHNGVVLIERAPEFDLLQFSSFFLCELELSFVRFREQEVMHIGDTIVREPCVNDAPVCEF